MTKQDYERQVAALRAKRLALRKREQHDQARAVSKQIAALQNKRLDQLLGA